MLLNAATAAFADSPVVNHDDWNESKISGINVNKNVGIFPGIAIFIVRGYVIDLNPIQAATLPAGAEHNSVVDGYIAPR